MTTGERCAFVGKADADDFSNAPGSPYWGHRRYCNRATKTSLETARRAGPAPAAVEGMRAGPESEIGFAAPIFQIVPRTKARQRPIGDFVVVVAGFAQAFAGEFVRVGHGVVAGNGRGGVACSAGEQFA